MNLKYYILLLAVAGMAALPTTAANPETGSGETDGYHVVWQELFNGSELNPLRWNIEVNGDGGGNNELQYYREENVSVGDDGQGNNCLILTARRESYRGKSFTSGRVTTKILATFKHGKVEASIKLPVTANGLWPAFWMMGNDFDEVGWPRCGETDIVEMGNSNGISRGTTDRYFNGAMHWGQGWPAACYAKDNTWDYSLQDGEFHLFTAIWDDEAVSMYLDLDKYPNREPYYKMTIPANEPGNEWSPGNYFHKENFILFNLAVGGDFTGIHQADRVTALNAGNGNEAKMYVNYLRIYQKGTPDESHFFLDPGDDLSGVAEATISSLTMRPTTVGLTVSEDCRLTVTAAAGQNVMSCDVRAGEVNLTHLERGVYVARAVARDGRVTTLKFTR